MMLLTWPQVMVLERKLDMHEVLVTLVIHRISRHHDAMCAWPQCCRLVIVRRHLLFSERLS